MNCGACKHFTRCVPSGGFCSAPLPIWVTEKPDEDDPSEQPDDYADDCELFEEKGESQ